MARLIRILIAFLVLFALASHQASACINDREVERSEREFKSTYQKGATPEREDPTDRIDPVAIPILLIGLSMFAGAAIIIRLRGASDSPADRAV